LQTLLNEENIWLKDGAEQQPAAILAKNIWGDKRPSVLCSEKEHQSERPFRARQHGRQEVCGQTVRTSLLPQQRFDFA